MISGLIRPSKFRFPDNTDTTAKSLAWTAALTSAINGPEFPIHVVHPYPTKLKPNLSRYGVNPDRS